MDMKKLMEIKEVPYTITNSSMGAIWGIITAMIMVIASIIFYAVSLNSEMEEVALGVLGFSIGSIISFPVLIFLLSLGSAFLFTITFNLVARKFEAIEVGFDNNRLVKINPISYGLVNAIIGTIIGLLWNLAIGPMLYLGLASTNPYLLISLVGNIMGSIIGSAAGGFIAGGLFAITYNFIVKYVNGALVEFEERHHGFVELVKVDPVSTAISLTLVHTFWITILVIACVIFAAIFDAFVPALVIGIITIVLTFIFSFISIAVTAVIYNFLVNKTGGYKFRFDGDIIGKSNIKNTAIFEETKPAELKEI